MQTLNQSLTDLYLKGFITHDDALGKSQEPEEIKRMITERSSSQGGRERAVRQ